MKQRMIVKSGMLAALMCAVSPLAVPLPLSPVPLTLQTLVLMIIAVVAARQAVWITACYLAVGMLGFPVFSGFKGGLAVLLGPTGGFLLGFLPCSLFLGKFLHQDLSLSKVFLLLLAGNALVYACGIPWLSFYMNNNPAAALKSCLVFIPGDLLKAAVVCVNFRLIIRFRKLCIPGTVCETA